MFAWTVTIPTIRPSGAEQVRGSQTWVIRARRPRKARKLALAAATTESAVRHRRGAMLDTTAIDVAPWYSDDLV
ncbi:hypothetical protein [Streptomyces sp. NPDC001250]|uniref:hypothetical protein n=1 Tax=unclassified Streptomyces TaxID=2593676 RepID=UPI0033309280